MIKNIFNWQKWNIVIFYFPIIIYLIFLSIKARSVTFFGLTNPIMKTGGFYFYSKSDILMRLPQEYYPKTKVLNEKDEKNFEEVNNFFENKYPLIVKPDIGERGYHVNIINSKKELEEILKYLNCYPLIVQEYIDLPNEYGAMYIKYPKEKKGKITFITGKSFLKVKGNNKLNIKELINKIEITSEQRKKALKFLNKRLYEVPKEDEEIIIEPIGNHCRGTDFNNRNDLLNEILSTNLVKILNNIDGFYFGRIDLKAKSDKEFEDGKIKIIEINGVNSEPTNIYSKGSSLFFAYKEIIKNWNIIFKIAIQNKKKYLYFPSFKEYICIYKDYLKYKYKN